MSHTNLNTAQLVLRRLLQIPEHGGVQCLARAVAGKQVVDGRQAAAFSPIEDQGRQARYLDDAAPVVGVDDGQLRPAARRRCLTLPRFLPVSHQYQPPTPTPPHQRLTQDPASILVTARLHAYDVSFLFIDMKAGDHRSSSEQVERGGDKAQRKAVGTSLAYFQSAAAGIASVYCSTRSLQVTVVTTLLALVASWLLGRVSK